METNNELELKEGVFYIDNSDSGNIIRYEPSNLNYCMGYWRRAWKREFWTFFTKYKNNGFREATYEELEALGTEHRPYSKYLLEDNETKVYTIKDLSEGRVATYEDGCIWEQLALVINTAFPENTYEDFESYVRDWKNEYYLRSYKSDDEGYSIWGSFKETTLPTQPISVFLKELEGSKDSEVELQIVDSQPVEPKNEAVYVKRFPSGAVRSDSRGKLRVDFVSPYAIQLIAKHHTKNSDNFNDEDKFGANYMKGIKPKDIDPSLERHWLDYRIALLEGDAAMVKEELVALASNCMMALHQIVLEEKGLYKEEFEDIEFIKK